jgi:hypothetical protein
VRALLQLAEAGTIGGSFGQSAAVTGFRSLGLFKALQNDGAKQLG